MDYLKHNPVDGFLWGGDQLNLEEVSHHSKGKPRLRPRGALNKNLMNFDTTILRRVEGLLKPDAEKRFHVGNHERFIQDLLDEQPELEGMISIEEKLKLNERGWKVVPLAGHSKLGHLYVLHGDSVGGGMNPAKKAVETWCASLAMGHHHTSQSYTKSSPVHQDRKWTAHVIPCLSTTAPSYGRGKHTRTLTDSALSKSSLGDHPKTGQA
jgi:hypothetical protein